MTKRPSWSDPLPMPRGETPRDASRRREFWIVDAATIARVEAAVSAAVEPQDDIHASADYRRSLVGTMVERALLNAAK